MEQVLIDRTSANQKFLLEHQEWNTSKWFVPQSHVDHKDNSGLHVEHNSFQAGDSSSSLNISVF